MVELHATHQLNYYYLAAGDKINILGMYVKNLQDAMEGQMTEMKEVGKTRTQLLDDLRNRQRY